MFKKIWPREEYSSYLSILRKLFYHLSWINFLCPLKSFTPIYWIPLFSDPHDFIH